MKAMNLLSASRFGSLILIATAFQGMPSDAAAQDSLQVTFVGDRELEVRDVVKPASSPTRVDLGMAKPTINYAPIAKSIAPVTQVRTIEPFAVRMDAPLPRLYAGYAKGGFGLYTSPFADIHYGETQSRKGSWGSGNYWFRYCGFRFYGTCSWCGLYFSRW